MHKRFAIILIIAPLWFSYAFAQPVQDMGQLLGQAIEDINFQDFDMAEQKLTQVLAAEPDNPYAKYYMASVLAQTKRSKQAIPYLESIQDAKNLFPDYDTLLASVYMEANQPNKAVPIYKAMFEQNMFEPEIIFQYANALEKNGNFDQALAHYRLLTKKDNPYKDAANFQIANIYMQFGAQQHASHSLEQIPATSAYAESAQASRQSLAAADNPLSIYASFEYFFNDNPGSASSTYAKGAVPQAPAQGSTGQTLVAVLSSKAWEINYRTQAKLAYTYYNTSYAKEFAKSNDFTGHFFAPSLGYTFSPQWRLDAKIDYQILNLGEYNLANNYGGSLSIHYTAPDQLSSYYTSLSYMRKRHNHAFGAAGATVDMQYLDANSPTFGAGGYLVYSDYYAVLSVDYSLLWERTLTNTNAVLNEKAQDSEFREHSLSINHHLPLDGLVYQGLSFDVSLAYSFRNYLNPQSGTSLPSIKPGNYFTAETTTAGAKLLYDIGSSYHLNTVLGYDWANATSQATELSYKQTRYYVQLSGSY